MAENARTANYFDCRLHRRINSNELKGEDVAQFEALVKESHGKELEISERLKVVLVELEAKGGDVKEAQAYINSAMDVSAELDSTGKVQYVIGIFSLWFMDREGGIVFAGRLGVAAAVMLGFWFLSRLSKRLVKKAFVKNQKGSRIMRNFTIRSIGWVVMTIGIMVALSTLGVEVGPMMAALGAGGFIIGFALQDTIANFASGMMIMVYRPFDEGDFVEISGISGKVEKMSLVSTTLLTLDNKELIIPNKKAWGETITNYSGRDVRRVDLVFGIGYTDDIEKTIRVLRALSVEHALVLEDPGTTVGVHSLGDSSVNIFLRPWSKTEDYWDVHWDLTKAAKQKFDDEGISIPFPQRDVHVQQIHA
ncbi:mechanosensitive ion channel family protein [Rubritalea profundi]|uniref:mechanosensitive ion channel family protein n=1 Tax=Rubritalea profundi TaxID=1658618 RepID=UPI000CF5777C|nr:mechanosensitive ion channel family protein [Rubritalea profundi]